MKNANQGGSSNLLRNLGVGAVACGVLAVAVLRGGGASETAPTHEQRAAVFQSAVAEGAATKDGWPATEQALITEFWQQASQKNWDRMLVLVPGSTRKDFAIFDQFTPAPAKAIGEPRPLPGIPGVNHYPVTVPFPNFPNKTVMMAVVRLPDGRLIIDGSRTIWW